MTQNIQLSKIKPNTGQILGLPPNPRFIRDEKFEALKKSLQDDPEMLELRELIVFPHKDVFVVIGGNMRYRAATELGITTLSCKVLSAETPIDKLRAFTIKDNTPYGQWDMGVLAEWSLQELSDWGLDTPFGNVPEDIDKFFEDANKSETKKKSIICPHCNKEIEL